jgi:hypothetical protein
MKSGYSCPINHKNDIEPKQFRCLHAVPHLAYQIIFIFVALALYQLLKVPNRNIAVQMVILLLISIPIAMIDELNNLAVLFLVSGADFLKVFTAAQLVSRLIGTRYPVARGCA